MKKRCKERHKENMKRYFIEAVKRSTVAADPAAGHTAGQVVATVRYNEGRESKWLSLIEIGGMPFVALSDKDIHDNIAAGDFGGEGFAEFMDRLFISDFDGIEVSADYYDTFQNIYNDPANPAVPLIRYLIALARCDENEVEALIEMAAGNFADELDIPAGSEEDAGNYVKFVEYEDDDEEDAEEVELPKDLDKESIYRMRLSLEADLETRSVLHDMDPGVQANERKRLQALKKSCGDEEEYEVWKETYIAGEYEKVRGQRFLTCTYAFEGIGRYETTFPVDQKEAFICWLGDNEAAYYEGDREASEGEVRRYLAQQAAANLE